MATEWLLVASIAAALATPVVVRIARRRFDPFEPLTLFVLAYGTAFVARPAAMMVSDDFTYIGVDIRPGFGRMLVLASLGAVAFVAAYELGLAGRLATLLPVPPADVPTRAVATASAAVALLGTVVLVVFLPTSRGLSSVEILLGGRTDELGRLLDASPIYMWYGSLLLVPAALCLFALVLRQPTPGLLVLTVVVAGLALLRTVPVGSRIALLPLAGGLVTFLYLRRHARPSRAALALGVVIALVGSYTLLWFRDPELRGRTAAGLVDLLSNPEQVARPVLRGADGEVAATLSGALLAIPEQLHYRYGGAVLGDLVTRPIPRDLWAGKPPTPAERIVEQVWPGGREYFNPVFSPLVFFFWDFGLAGAAAGLALYGLLARTAYEYLRLHAGRLAVQLLFAVGLWYVVILVRSNPVDALIQAAFVLAPIPFIFWLAARIAGRRPAAT